MDGAAEGLKARLGHQRYAELVSAGAALGDDAAIAYARRYTARDPTDQRAKRSSFDPT
jgi:hypothetical protein